MEDPDYTAGSAADIFELSLTVTDSGGLSGTDTATLVVYDPDDGFVTGGGWIDSPAGAYAADPSLTGKATFAFVSKYTKGKQVPTGHTQFSFKAGDLNYSSAYYDWLVVTGNDTAMFTGAGTINGLPGPQGQPYKFIARATDGQPDTLRIRIWWEDGGAEEHVVYDNGTEQAIGDGSITIQTGKGK